MCLAVVLLVLSVDVRRLRRCADDEFVGFVILGDVRWSLAVVRVSVGMMHGLVYVCSMFYSDSCLFFCFVMYRAFIQFHSVVSGCCCLVRTGLQMWSLPLYQAVF